MIIVLPTPPVETETYSVTLTLTDAQGNVSEPVTVQVPISRPR